MRRRPPRPPNPRYHPPERRSPAVFEPRVRRHVRVQAVALQLCSAGGFVSMRIRLVVIRTGHPSSPSCAYRRETNVDVRCAQDPQTDRLRRRRLERFLMGLIIETCAVPPTPLPSRPLRPASRTSCLKFTFCRRRQALLGRWRQFAALDRRVLVAVDAADRRGGPQGSGEPGASRQPPYQSLSSPLHAPLCPPPPL